MAVEAQFCSGNYLVPQDLMTSVGDGLNAALCFNTQPQIVQQSSHSLLGLAQIVDSLSQQQQREIDQYIVDQYEGLRLNLQEQRKRDLTSIINRIEIKSRHMLLQKDQDIAGAKNRTAQLEQILHDAQTEHQQWQMLALDREAQVIHLNNTLQQMLHSFSSSLYNSTIKNGKDGDDAESCCDVDCSEKDRGAGMLCKKCGERDACVVLLPCRHLCCCVVCEMGIDSCPVCQCLKQNAIQCAN